MIIYIITNTINDKVYIGQSVLTKEERWKAYKHDYKYETRAHLQRPILNAMRKYGIKCFTMTVLVDNVSTKEELDELERSYITKYQSLITQKGYNVELGGNGPGKHAEETKRKISIAQQGELNHMYGKRGALNPTSKKVIDITTDKIYDAAVDAANELNLNFSHVCGVARGSRLSTKGHVFRYLDENNQPIAGTACCKTKESYERLCNLVLDKYKYLVVNTVPSLNNEEGVTTIPQGSNV